MDQQQYHHQQQQQHQHQHTVSSSPSFSSSPPVPLSSVATGSTGANMMMTTPPDSSTSSSNAGSMLPVRKKPSRSRACEPCRRRKLRCDTLRPACGSCKSSNKPEGCIYSGVPPRPQNRKDAERVKELEEKVFYLESLLMNPARTMLQGMLEDDFTEVKEFMTDQQEKWDKRKKKQPRPHSADENYRSSSSSSSASGSGSDVEIKNNGSSSSTSSQSPLFQPKYEPSLAGSNKSSPPPPAPIPSNWSDSNHSSSSPGIVSVPGELPLGLRMLGCQELVGSVWWFTEFKEDSNPLELAHTFFCQQQAVGPLLVVHKGTFLFRPETISPFLRLCILGCGARLSPENDVNPEFMIRSERLFKIARSYLSSYIDEPHIHAVQGLLTMVMCSAATNRNSAANMYLGMLTRMALILELNIDPDDYEKIHNVQLPWYEKESRRRTWWAVFSLDRSIAGIANQPPLLKSYSDQAVKDPANDDLWESLQPVDSINLSLVSQSRPSSKIPLFRVFWNILELFSRIISFSRGPAGLWDRGDEDGVNGQGDMFTTLEIQLGEWFLGLPEELRRKMLSIDENTRFSIRFFDDMPWQTVVITLTYFGCLCVLHRRRLLLAIGAQSTLGSPSSPVHHYQQQQLQQLQQQQQQQQQQPPSNAPDMGSIRQRFGNFITNTRLLTEYDHKLAMMQREAAGIIPGVNPSPVIVPSTHKSYSALPGASKSPDPFTSPKMQSIPLIPAESLRHSLYQGHRAAVSVGRLVAIINKTNPRFLHLSSYAGLALIESTLVLSLIVTRGAERATLIDLAEAVQARRLIDGNMEAIGQFAKTVYAYRNVTPGLMRMLDGTPKLKDLMDVVEMRKRVDRISDLEWESVLEASFGGVCVGSEDVGVGAAMTTTFDGLLDLNVGKTPWDVDDEMSELEALLESVAQESEGLTEGLAGDGDGSGKNGNTMASSQTAPVYLGDGIYPMASQPPAPANVEASVDWGAVLQEVSRLEVCQDPLV
ncbi:hypothetical protein HDU76_013460 [Blyttiomyces sp. JEL0837]|nr:hypothetical protein HDU76_013460 [Blyttiomyces sp. JEL0837]